LKLKEGTDERHDAKWTGARKKVIASAHMRKVVAARSLYIR